MRSCSATVTSGEAPLLRGVPRVVGFGPEEQMAEANAARVVAGVKDTHLWSDRPVRQNPNLPMDRGGLAFNSDLGVSQTVAVTRAFPTADVWLGNEPRVNSLLD